MDFPILVSDLWISGNICVQVSSFLHLDFYRTVIREGIEKTNKTISKTISSVIEFMCDRIFSMEFAS
jgi:hypothetical protein